MNINEIKGALKGMKNGNAPEFGDVSFELIKYRPDILFIIVAELFMIVWLEEKTSHLNCAQLKKNRILSQQINYIYTINLETLQYPVHPRGQMGKKIKYTVST